jgi:hypothetical protein
MLWNAPGGPERPKVDSLAPASVAQGIAGCVRATAAGLYQRNKRSRRSGGPAVPQRERGRCRAIAPVTPGAARSCCRLTLARGAAQGICIIAPTI